MKIELITKKVVYLKRLFVEKKNTLKKINDMKKVLIILLSLIAMVWSMNAAPGELTTTPSNPTVNNSITLIYEPLPNQSWMLSQDVFIYTCLEFDDNGEWVKQKAEWSKTSLSNFKWVKEDDGKLYYIISNIKTFFNLTDDEVSRVSGIFVILKNEKFQSTDKYVAIRGERKPVEKFTGTVSFEVKVPEGTKSVYVAGTFGPEGTPNFWKHADEKYKLTRKDATTFVGVIKDVPEDLQYLYVYGSRVDQAEFRMGHRPLGGKTKVHDVVEYWGDMTLNVSVPKGTKEVYVSGNFNNWGHSLMTDIGNNTWIYHVPPVKIGADEQVEYKYYTKADKTASEPQQNNRKLKFVGFSTQYDEVTKW